MLNWLFGHPQAQERIRMNSNIPRSIVVSLGLTIFLASAFAQVAGFAEITYPTQGDRLQGLVTILGTADHPDFEGFELAFAHDPNPTGTWFPVTDRLRTPVQDDRLALWDTDEISPGTYQLRLTVFAQSGTSVEATVSDLQLGQEVAGEAPAPSFGEADTQPKVPADGEAAEAMSPQSLALPETAEATIGRLLLLGAAGATAVLMTFGMYTVLRPRVREYMGRLRVRQLRRERRQRRAGRDR